MSGGLGLEQRYRRVLRLLPGYYRDRWEEDMVAAWSRQAAGSGVWSLTLTLLAAVAGAYRIVTLTAYQHDPYLITVSLAELIILVAAAALVAPDAARAQAATPAPPPYPGTIAA